MLESITLGQIITAIGGLAVIAGFFTGIFKWYKSHITDEFAKLNNKLDSHMKTADKKIEAIEGKIELQDAEMQDSKEERLILLKGLLACLKGLHNDLNCNGPVTQGISEVENYLIKKSHE